MPLLAVLEDDARRIVQTQSASASVLAECELKFFTDANEMKSWLPSNLDQVQLLSLDCDLDATALAGVECGSGEDVIDFLVQRLPKCPIIIHSSNALRAPAMHMQLAFAGCAAVRLCPFSDGERWVRDVRTFLEAGHLAEDA